jgi:hypothetical protein
MGKLMQNRFLGAGLVCLAAGCTAGTTTLKPLTIDALPAGSEGVAVAPNKGAVSAVAAGKAEATPPKPGAAPVDCEVRLFAEQLPTHNPQGIADNSVGAFFVERDPGNQKQVFGGVCIKRPEQPLQLPASILIAADPEGVSLERFCSVGSEPFDLVPSAPAKSAVKVNACTWNGVFHSTRPFTFTLLSQPGTAVGDYVEVLRVYRNGDLMAAWNYASDQRRPDKVVVDGNGMRTGLFAATYPPHLAAMDLRIVPRETGVAHVVEMEVRDDRARFQAKLSTAAKAAADVALPPDSPERASLTCLTSQLAVASAALMSVVDRVAIPKLPVGCTPLIDAGGGTPLSDAYRDVKNQSQAELETLRAKADERVIALRARVEAKIPAATRDVLGRVYGKVVESLPAARKAAVDTIVKTCIQKFGTAGTDAKCFNELRAIPEVAAVIEPLLQTAVTLDQSVSNMLESADEARLLASNLYARGRDILASPQKQAEIYSAFTASLASQGSPFEPRRDNPPLLPSEQKLEMQFADKFQWFAFAPWNAVPLRVDDNFDADFNAAITIPLLDVGGARYQWGRSRFAEFRGAFGIGVIQTESPDDKPKRATLMPHASISLGTFRLGGGFALGNDLGNGAERFRLLVGFDLFKLITGSNIEAL